MNPTTAVADGVLPHGSFDITILETGELHVADNFQLETDGKLLRANNKSGNPSRQKVLKGWSDGSCDLQLADEDSPKPDIGHHFAADEDKDGNDEPFLVVKSGKTFTADDITKCKVSITRCLHPVINASGGKTLAQLCAGVSYVEDVAITAINFSALLPPGEVIDDAVWSSTALPVGLVLNAGTGALTGTPTTPAAALAVTITVTLASGKKATFTFEITITVTP